MNKILLSLLLCFCLSGCTKVVYIKEPEFVEPPSSLLEDCPIAELQGNKVVDAIEQSIKNISNLQDCNTDKKSLREFVKENKIIYKDRNSAKPSRQQ